MLRVSAPGTNQMPPLPFSTMDAMALFTDAHEVAVVILGVVELAALAPDDAPCAAAALTRRLHRVLTIVAAILLGQERLAVAEHCAVLRVGIGTALADERDGVARF